MIYNSDFGVLQWCNGTDWRGLPYGKDPYGYFVISEAIFDGNLGGLSGANAACLNEVTSKPWKGKDAFKVPLKASNVRAWLCDATTCQNPLPGGSYKIAVSNSVASGGTILNFDAAGLGPYDTNSWGTYNVWTGRSYHSQSSNYFSQLWEDNVFPDIPSAATCNSWSGTAATGQRGVFSSSGFSASDRWSASASACTTLNRLVCLVDPIGSYDNTPDNPGFVNVSNAELSTQYTTIGTITGIIGSVNVTITDYNIYGTVVWNAEVRNITTASAWSNRITVNSGDQIEIRSTSLPVFGAVKSIKISIGTQNFVWTITTKSSNPEVGFGILFKTYNSYKGNLGGLAGANQKCLDEALSERSLFRGKISLSPANVRAFLCDSTTCNNLQPNRHYRFDGMRFGYGGAIFFTDGSGLGLNTTGYLRTNDSASAYPFGGVWGGYWTGRAAGSSTAWGTSTSGNHCTNWTTSSAGFNGTYGDPFTKDGKRWSFSTYSCDTALPLLCIIEPTAKKVFFTDVLSGTRNTQYTDSFTFSALTAPVSVTVLSGLVEVKKNAGAWGTNIPSIDNGDTLYVRMTSSPLGNAARIGVLQVGDVKIEWIVRNRDVVNDEQYLARAAGSPYQWVTAMSGNTAVVTHGTSNIYIYERTGSTWSSAGAVNATIAVAAVTIKGNTIVASNVTDSGAVSNGGAVAIIEKGATWGSSTITIKRPSNTSTFSYFGRGLALEGNILAVASGKSSFYIYENTGSGWASATETIINLPTTSDYSGAWTSVALKGNTAVVGTYPVNFAGTVQVVQNTGAGWATPTITTLTPSGGHNNDACGSSVDISSDENTIVVGCKYRRGIFDTGLGLTEAGTAFIFEKGTSWGTATSTQLVSPIETSGGAFGQTVKIQDDIIVASSLRSMGEGALYLYKKSGTWGATSPEVLLKRNSSTNLTYGLDYLGYGAAICGNWAVALSPYNSFFASDGAVFFFDVSALTGGSATCP